MIEPKERMEYILSVSYSIGNNIQQRLQSESILNRVLIDSNVHLQTCVNYSNFRSEQSQSQHRITIHVPDALLVENQRPSARASTQ